MTYAKFKHDPTFPSIFDNARWVIRHVNRARWTGNEYVYGTHHWHIKQQDKYQIHPVVYKIVQEGVRPIDWHLLLLEWPHVSEDDPMQIAYTRDERKGTDDVQTRTSIGKYLSRHWPHVPDHVRRDWSESYGNHKFELWDTMEQIICGIELGPQSCMKSSYGTIPFSEHDNARLCTWFGGDKSTHVDWEAHPYAVYVPEYGWRMAVRLDPGKPDIVLGRGLVNTTGMQFVRTYKRGEYDSSNSGTDERLEAWLKGQGYTKRSEWANGLRLRRLDHPTSDAAFMVPYIDGNNQTVCDDSRYLTIDEDGAFKCDNTNGVADGCGRETLGGCACCGSTVYEDDEDRVWAGVYEDDLICGCCSEDYRYVRGIVSGRDRGYYVHEDREVTVGAHSYDRENLPDYIVLLDTAYYACDQYEHVDNCYHCEATDTHFRCDDVIFCETDDAWYPDDDPAAHDLVEIEGKWYTEDDDVFEFEGTWYLKEDGWEDAKSNEWYPDSEEAIELNGDKYHPRTIKQALIDAGQMSLDM